MAAKKDKMIPSEKERKRALHCALKSYISTLSLAKNSACQNIRTQYNIKCEQILKISRIHNLYFKRTYPIAG